MDRNYAEAITWFEDLLDRARHTSLREPTAMALATVDADGRPAVRIVLLRGFGETGFVFYTNTTSRKGQELEKNPHVALCFHWDELAVQIRVEGAAERVAATEANTYWQSRPRSSQIGAWASQQSATLTNRGELENRFRAYEDQFAGRDVPRPDFWTGYCVLPDRIEFWFNRPSRLHDRVLYQRDAEGRWEKSTLYP